MNSVQNPSTAAPNTPGTPSLERMVAQLKDENLKMLALLRQMSGVIANCQSRIDGVRHEQRLPTHFFHWPIDFEMETYPPNLGTPIHMPGEELPVPPPNYRPGYSPDDNQRYIDWGKSDHDHICQIIKKHHEGYENLKLLDFGCSSGRVLRHFVAEQRAHNWKLIGIDIQAVLIEWMRRNFPPNIQVLCGTAMPHLPFEDNSLDAIYGISVFTHTKYQWDTWLMEFKRVLKPGGLCMQSVQCEAAWEFYHQNRHEKWVADGHPKAMLEKPHMDRDYLYYGNPDVSQTFYKRKILIEFWSRYMEVVDFLPPPAFSYQNWIVLRKPAG
jgi:SAM-dependent methyltransferase